MKRLDTEDADITGKSEMYINLHLKYTVYTSSYPPTVHSSIHHSNHPSINTAISEKLPQANSQIKLTTDTVN